MICGRKPGVAADALFNGGQGCARALGTWWVGGAPMPLRTWYMRPRRPMSVVVRQGLEQVFVKLSRS